MLYKKIFCIVFVMLLLCGCKNNQNLTTYRDYGREYIEFIQNTYVGDKHITYLYYFEKFFRDMEWSYFQDESGHFVNFSGNFNYCDKSVRADIVFEITDEENVRSFKISKVLFDGVIQDNITIRAFLDSIFNE